MPIFEFKCESCGEVFESFILRGAEKINCPKCGSEKIAKLLSAPNLCGSSDGSSHSGCGGKSSGFS